MRRLCVGILVPFLLLASPLFAGTPDKVTCPAQINCIKCTTADGAGKKTCKIQISRANVAGAWVATAQALDQNGKPVGTPNQDICLDSTVPVTFISDPAPSTSFYGVVFGSNNPFTGFNPIPALFSGGVVAGTPVPSSAATPAANLKGCYTFDISFCQYSMGAPLNCAGADPQVIVDGGDRLEMCIEECQLKLHEGASECSRKCKNKLKDKD